MVRSGDYDAAFLMRPTPRRAGAGDRRRRREHAAEVDLLLPQAADRAALQPACIGVCRAAGDRSVREHRNSGKRHDRGSDNGEISRSRQGWGDGQPRRRAVQAHGPGARPPADSSTSRSRRPAARTPAPDPQELLAVSLASCTAITMEMYASRKGWDIGHVEVDVEYSPAERGCPTKFDVVLRLPDEPARGAGRAPPGDRRQVPRAPRARRRGHVPRAHPARPPGRLSGPAPARGTLRVPARRRDPRGRARAAVPGRASASRTRCSPGAAPTCAATPGRSPSRAGGATPRMRACGDRPARGRRGDRPAAHSQVSVLGELRATLDLRHQLPDPPVRRPDPRRARLATVPRGGRRRARATAAGAPGRRTTHRAGAARVHLRDGRLRRRGAPHLGRHRADRRSPARAPARRRTAGGPAQHSDERAALGGLEADAAARSGRGPSSATPAAPASCPHAARR